MSYQVLARKCRPQRFAEIVGQEHITRTLQNAIRQGRVGHAYLFVGSRGIGKTTTARIFAKALNCEAGTVIEPCCQCQSCREIAAGNSLDVIEIDGASHNKVEHIRDLRDNVQYTPARSRYKIYIIDEVHMLTPQAWNALLKTLEEPPPHVKFLFATTEPHKVLPTIVSRCQRFDLKRLSVRLIAERLRDIASSEKIAIDEGALVAIARAADGGMRDAQSIFDQIISFCGNGQDGVPIVEEDVINVFGLASGRELSTVTAALVGNRQDQFMAVVHDLADRGRDLERFFADLVFHFRNVMIFQTCKDAADILDVSDSERADLVAIARQAPARLVQRMLEGLVAEEGRLRMALNKRVYLEVALVRVANEAHSVQLEDIIKRLNEIRGTGGPAMAELATPVTVILPEPPAPKPASRPPAPISAAPAPVPPPAPAPATTPAIQPKVSAPPAAMPVVPSAIKEVAPATPPPAPVKASPQPTPPPAKAEVAESATVAPAAPVQAAAPAPAMAPVPAAAPTVAATPPPPSDPLPPENPAPARKRTTKPKGTATGKAKASSPAVELHGSEEAQAAQLLEALRKEVQDVVELALLAACLAEIQPITYRDGVLELAYNRDTPVEHVEELQRDESLGMMAGMIQKLTGQAAPKVLVKEWVAGISDASLRQRLVSSPEVFERVGKNPFVQKTLDLFGGEIIDVRGS